MSWCKDAFQDPLTMDLYQLSHLDVFSTFFEAPNSANDTSQVLWGISEFYVTIKLVERIIYDGGVLGQESQWWVFNWEVGRMRDVMAFIYPT